MGHAPKRRVVAIGGGTGLSSLLRGLKAGPFAITAIVTVADDGGSTGRLRAEMDIPAPGDIRNVLVALAEKESLLSALMQYRFRTNGALSGHALGNLLIAAMSDITGDFAQAVRALSRVLAVRGVVLPAANAPLRLKAELADGTVVEGESNIPKAGRPIRRVMIDPPDAAPLPEALQAIREAELILLGPGSLYTSLIPNLLVPGLVRAIAESRAPKAFIVNLMTQPGETDGYTALDHVAAVEAHSAPKLFDVLVVNTGPIPEPLARRYREGGQEAVRVDREVLRARGYRLIEDDFVLADPKTGLIRHDAVKVGERLLSSLF